MELSLLSLQAMPDCYFSAFLKPSKNIQVYLRQLRLMFLIQQHRLQENTKNLVPVHFIVRALDLIVNLIRRFSTDAFIPEIAIHFTVLALI